jgi:hypothetical protein
MSDTHWSYDDIRRHEMLRGGTTNLIEACEKRVRELVASEIKRKLDMIRQLSYLAVPFSHANPTIKWQRFVACTKVAARMTTSGITVFSPITHSAPLELIGGVTGSWDLWQLHDTRYLNCCKELFVLTIPGWSTSTGVTAEREYAKRIGIPVYYVSWADAPQQTFWDSRPWEGIASVDTPDYTKPPTTPDYGPEVCIIEE